MVRENHIPIGYVSIILTGLVIGYFLFITNPPPGLLRYDNDNLKTAVPYHLSASDLRDKFFDSIMVFMAAFFLMSAFLAYVFLETFSEKKGGTVVYVYLSLVSTLMFALVAYPYYGFNLMMLLFSVGLMGWIFSICLYDKIYRKGNFTRSNVPFLVRSFAALFWILFTVFFDTLLDFAVISIAILVIAYLIIRVSKMRKKS